LITFRSKYFAGTVRVFTSRGGPRGLEPLWSCCTNRDIGRIRERKEEKLRDREGRRSSPPPPPKKNDLLHPPLFTRMYYYIMYGLDS
jgi:hypothetical protein